MVQHVHARAPRTRRRRKDRLLKIRAVPLRQAPAIGLRVAITPVAADTTKRRERHPIHEEHAVERRLSIYAAGLLCCLLGDALSSGTNPIRCAGQSGYAEGRRLTCLEAACGGAD